MIHASSWLAGGLTHLPPEHALGKQLLPDQALDFPQQPVFQTLSDFACGHIHWPQEQGP